jgi:CDP-4-dehydro-6-deoxyglucose reductase
VDIVEDLQFSVTNASTGRSFSCGGSQSVIDGALDAKILLLHGCNTGKCGACAAELVSGETRSLDQDQRRTSDHRRLRLCRVVPASDLVIRATELPWREPVPVKRFPVRVSRKDLGGRGVMLLSLKLPRRETFGYRPGQYVGLEAADGRLRYFSLATSAPRDGAIELHIRRVVGGLFTEHVWERLSVGDILWVQGPFGNFNIADDDEGPALLVAGGTGFAPIRALLEQLAQANPKRELYLYWGGRDLEDFYQHDALETLKAALPRLRTALFPGGSAPTGPSGARLLNSVVAAHRDLSSFQAYVCGSPGLVEAARDALTLHANLLPENFHSDAFTVGDTSI